MTASHYHVRNALPSEFEKIGQLMVQVYAALEGFPGPEEQPAYYQLLRDVGRLTEQPGVEILVAADPAERIAGALLYVGDMQYYGSGGIATIEKEAAGFRLLAMDPLARGQGIGRLLSNACIEKARAAGHTQLIIHSTRAMQTAWKLYESIGFHRSTDLDFMQGTLEVFGFRLDLPAQP